MSCGPSKALASLADKVDLANEKIDELILQPTVGKLDELKSKAEDEINEFMGDLETMIPEIDLGLDIEIPDSAKGMLDDFKEVGNFVMLGLAKKDALIGKMKQIEGKWSGVDLGNFKDLNDVSAALRSGAADLDSLCKLLPNAQVKQKKYTIKEGDTLSEIAEAQGVSVADIMAKNPQIKDADKILAGAEITIPGKPGEAIEIDIKGTPLTNWDFDLGNWALGGVAPEFKAPKFKIDTNVVWKDVNDDFINVKLPNIDLGNKNKSNKNATSTEGEDAGENKVDATGDGDG